MTLKVGISGLRGTVDGTGERLTADTVVAWVQAFVGYLQSQGCTRPLIALGHDARRSSPALAALARGALLMAGADLLDLGLTLTPTVQHAVRRDSRIDGGLMITASHNPLIWNGLKFVDEDGYFLPLSAWDAIGQRIDDATLPAQPLDQVGHALSWGEEAWQAHQRAVLAALPRELIRAKRYRVALDACNGGAARWVEPLRALGCEVLLLHSEQDGFLAREAEPIPANLAALRSLVLSSRSDVGFAADPDGDRLALVDGAGDAVSEEHTVVLAAQAVAQRGDRVVANVVTTHALEGALPGIEVIRSAVGEMNVVNAVLAHHAVLGGEGSGGIIVPPMNMARDGLAAATLILTLMAQRDAPLKTLVDALPRWQAVKEKLPAPADGSGQLAALMQRWRTAVPTVQAEGPSTLRVGDGEATVRLQWDDQQLTLVVEQPDSRFESRTPVAPLRALLTRLRDRAEPLTIDMTDGLKLSGNGAWLSLRASNTEPIFRLMGEVAER